MLLREAKEILKSNGYRLVEEQEQYTPDYIFTGLQAKEEYGSIISAVVGQIYDGIGEGFDRTSRIFRYYFEELIDVSSTEVNGEFVVKVEPNLLDKLINCIWRIAKIERDDMDSLNKNIYYEYLDAEWRDICALQAALKKVSMNGGKSSPWTEEDKQKLASKRANYKAKMIAKAEAEKKAAEEKEISRINTRNDMINNKISSITPDAKDIKRAEDAFAKYNTPEQLYSKGLLPQLNKITDENKRKRRIVAFYNVVKKYADNDKMIDTFADLIKTI